MSSFRIKLAVWSLLVRRRLRPIIAPIVLAGEFLVALLVAAGFGLVRLLPLEQASALGGAVARRVGPLTPAHRVARDNLRHAFPALDDARRAAILRGSWDNLGRMACEYAHIDHIGRIDVQDQSRARIEVSDATIEGFARLREDGLPALVFTAHLANWELPAVIAPREGLASAALYRTPNNRFVARRILALRSGLMGRLIPAGRQAPFALAAALGRGEHVGMLVDQRFGRGVLVPFLGRPAKTNTLFARLARQFDCPIYGVRTIRLPGVRFRMELVGPIMLPRDADGRVDLNAATETITRLVEGWIREMPEQWLWMHRRWRL